MTPSADPVVVTDEAPRPLAVRSFAALPAAVPQTAILTAAAAPPAPPPALVESPEPPAPPAPQRQVQAGTAQIQVAVEVTDPMNRFATGLGRESFRIFEDGVEQQVSQLSSDEVPISLGIVVDVSGSMGAKLEAERAAVFEFLKTARPADEFFLVPFNQDPVLVSGPVHT